MEQERKRPKKEGGRTNRQRERQKRGGKKGQRGPAEQDHVHVGEPLGSHLLFAPALGWMFLLVLRCQRAALDPHPS